MSVVDRLGSRCDAEFAGTSHSMTYGGARMLRNLLTVAMIIGLCSIAAVPAAASPAQHGAARGRVFIHRIFYNSPGSDHGSNSSLNAEWVDLRNSSGHPITLTRWTLRDKAGHVYKFKGFRLR